VRTHQQFADLRSSEAASLDEIRERFSTLSVAYVDVLRGDEEVDVSQTWKELKTLESERQTIENKLSST